MSQNECKYKFSNNLFWDTSLENIDLEEHAPYVIQRTLEYGMTEDWKLLLAYYGLDRIKKEAIQLRTLEPKALSYISALTNTPKNKFRCYTLKQSMPTHWNY